ncbi:MAG TPA: NUDIX domain-containing protein [Prolixibacteraceae bacterium]|nr:NUDIX domain-containing protein [Prolixibacteraceae bacterium]
MMTYRNKDLFYLAVDCVIFGYENYKLKLLLQPRPIQPSKGKWALMGGFCGHDESLEVAANRVLENTTGLTDIYMKQVQAFSAPDRDPGGHVVSVGFFALINIRDYDDNLLKQYGAQWFSIEEIPKLIFDHADIVEKAMLRLRRTAKIQPIGFELLPENFTITQLRNLYEAIYQCTLDPANFRRKIMSMKLLDRLSVKDKNSSRKGAYLYSFNQEKYENLTAQGFSFDISHAQM